MKDTPAQLSASETAGPGTSRTNSLSSLSPQLLLSEPTEAKRQWLRQAVSGSTCKDEAEEGLDERFEIA